MKNIGIILMITSIVSAAVALYFKQILIAFALLLLSIPGAFILWFASTEKRQKNKILQTGTCIKAEVLGIAKDGTMKARYLDPETGCVRYFYSDGPVSSSSIPSTVSVYVSGRDYCLMME